MIEKTNEPTLSPSTEPDEKHREGISRREALSTIARIGAAAVPFVAGASVAARQSPGPPRNLRIVTSPAGGRPVLTPNDLRFAGFIKLSPAAGNMYYTHGGFTIRTVSGDPRFLLWGNGPDGYPLLEFAMPDAAPGADVASAPVAALRRDWGRVMLPGRALTLGAAPYPGGLHWDAATNAAWWSFGEGYVPNGHDPSIGATLLNDSNGSANSYGPWRTSWHSQRTRGGMLVVPSSFASAYTGGNRTAIMSPQSSGNGLSPFGASLAAMTLPNPTSTPGDVPGSSHVTISNHGLILHDVDHRMARDVRYKTCGWAVKYNCGAGALLAPGVPLFGGADTGAGEDDTMSAAVWVDLPDKHGVLYFGQLVTTPDGYRAPGDPDGFVHMWYGDPYRSDGSGAQTCCHGQDDPWWGATGPGSHWRVAMGWIYNPDDLIATARGQASLWSRTPTSTFQWGSRVPYLSRRFSSTYPGVFGGAIFDAASRRIYVSLHRGDNVSIPPHSRPVIMVFDIA